MFSVPSWATWRHGAKDAFATKKNFWRDHRFITAKEWHDIPILHATTRADVRRSWLQECWMRRCVWWWPHLSVRSSPPAMAFPKSSRDTSLWTFILQLIKQCWRFKSKPSIGSCYRGNLQFQVTPTKKLHVQGFESASRCTRTASTEQNVIMLWPSDFWILIIVDIVKMTMMFRFYQRFVGLYDQTCFSLSVVVIVVIDACFSQSQRHTKTATTCKQILKHM